MTDLTTDVLGEPYTAETIPLPADDEGERVTTLVHRPADRPTDRAVLHVHGFSDYFFQTEYAEWWNARGYDFYAIDLPKAGRSWREHQTPHYVTDVDEHFPALDAVWAKVARDHRQVVVTGHSTGGLIAPLWADARQPAELTALVLNSPWLDLQGSAALRVLGTPLIKQVGRLRPKLAIPRSVNGLYTASLHREHGGEFDFDLSLKPLDSFVVYTGWLRAIRNGHARVHAGLDVPCPVLVLSSAASATPTTMGEEVYSTDIVLDVAHMRKWAPSLGHHVTYVAVEGAIHDVVLSRPGPRKQAYQEIERWLTAYAG